jgi:uncharacterized protein YndB with AHSA1/START domain
MSVTDTTPKGQTDAISFEVDLRHSPQKVWRAITDPALLAQWLLPVFEWKLEPGAAFLFKTEPHPPWDGRVRCQMLAIEPERELRYTWSVGDMELDTVVTFTLTPTATGTRLTLVQSGFQASQKQNWGGARYGWKMMSERLVALLAQPEGAQP